MAQILITAPIFIIIAIGYGAVRTGLVAKEFIPGLGRFVLYFTVPALIFRALSQTRLDEILNPWFLLAYGGGCLITFGLSLLFFRFAFKTSLTENGLNALGAALPNSIFIGFPVLLQYFGEIPASAFTMVLMVENIVIFSLALTIMEFGSVGEASEKFAATMKAVAVRIATNPMLLAILAGVIASATNLTLPETFDKVVEMFARASAAAALFFIGGVLVGINLKGRVTAISAVAFAKLIINPALVALLVVVLPPFDARLQIAAIVFAASPMLSIYPVIGAKFGLAQESASKLLLTTIASFASISTILWLLEHFAFK